MKTLAQLVCPMMLNWSRLAFTNIVDMGLERRSHLDENRRQLIKKFQINSAGKDSFSLELGRPSTYFFVTAIHLYTLFHQFHWQISHNSWKIQNWNHHSVPIPLFYIKWIPISRFSKFLFLNEYVVIGIPPVYL